MAALLVMVAVLTVLMSIVMPVWRHEAQREKEEELVFRGLQYVRAIRLYQAKTRALPPTIDALVQGHYLRKKYKDPITNADFVPIGAAGGVPGQVGQAGQPNQPGRGGRAGGGLTGQPRPPQSQPSQFGPESGGAQGGIIGVVSKSTAESIRVYQGRTHYNEWPFVFVNAQPGGPGGPGGTPDGRGVPGGPGGRGRPGGPGGRGRNPGGEMGPRPNPGRGMPSPNPRPPGGPGHVP